MTVGFVTPEQIWLTKSGTDFQYAVCTSSVETGFSFKRCCTFRFRGPRAISEKITALDPMPMYLPKLVPWSYKKYSTRTKNEPNYCVKMSVRSEIGTK